MSSCPLPQMRRPTARRSSKPTDGFLYRWRGMPAGCQKIAVSPIDALLEVLMQELKIKSVGWLMTELQLDPSCVSRCRHGKEPLQHFWLLRAAIFSGIPYRMLCELTAEEPLYSPHTNSWQEPSNAPRT